VQRSAIKFPAPTEHLASRSLGRFEYHLGPRNEVWSDTGSIPIRTSLLLSLDHFNMKPVTRWKPFTKQIAIPGIDLLFFAFLFCVTGSQSCPETIPHERVGRTFVLFLVDDLGLHLTLGRQAARLTKLRN